MATFSSLWPTVTGTDVLVWAAMDPSDTSRRMALYKNRSGVVGRMNGKQLAALNCTMENLPVIKTADEVAAALRAGYPAYFNWNYFDFILSATKEASVDGLADAVANINSQIDTKLSTVFSYKGSVVALTDLPVTDNKVGDVYQVQEDSYSEYVWVSGENPHWEFLGKVVDLSSYPNKTEMNESIAAAILAGKHVYSTKIITATETSNTLQNWIKAVYDLVQTGTILKDSIMIGGITVSDLPNNLVNAEIVLFIAEGNFDTIYGTIYTNNGGNPWIFHTTFEYTITNPVMLITSDVFNTHTKDTVVHITSAERSAWNAKASADSVTQEASSRAQADITLEESIQTETTNRSAAITAEETARINAINALTITKQFIRTATTQSLDSKIWYIASATLTATLPEAPIEGTECKISVVAGGESTTVAAAGSDTINGATTGLAISTANDTVSLIYDATNHNWLVL